MIGVSDLEESRKDLTVPGDRTLLPDLTGRDPDDATRRCRTSRARCS